MAIRKVILDVPADITEAALAAMLIAAASNVKAATDHVQRIATRDGLNVSEAEARAAVMAARGWGHALSGRVVGAPVTTSIRVEVSSGEVAQ